MRLDDYLVAQKLVPTRSQASDLIKRSKVKVNQNYVTKQSYQIKPNQRYRIKIDQLHRYVSRGGYKLESVASDFKLDFTDKLVLDVGSSKGGFSDFALKNRARLVVAVDVGSHQFDQNLKLNNKIILNEQTDIRDFRWPDNLELPDMILVDLSFISLTKILPSLKAFFKQDSQAIILFKPQFETKNKYLHKGLVKNSRIRQEALSVFENWLQENGWCVLTKADSKIRGALGNMERFYHLKLIKR